MIDDGNWHEGIYLYELDFDKLSGLDDSLVDEKLIH